jgi:uncharacterized protein YecA (UPF0149 family)
MMHLLHHLFNDRPCRFKFSIANDTADSTHGLSLQTASEVGRNDRRSCGSGKKDKKCCGGATLN